MRAPNEKYKEKNKDGYATTVWPKEYKDIFGYDIKVGAYVIWQPYSAHEPAPGQQKSRGAEQKDNLHG